MTFDEGIIQEYFSCRDGFSEYVVTEKQGIIVVTRYYLLYWNACSLRSIGYDFAAVIKDRGLKLLHKFYTQNLWKSLCIW